MSFDANLAELIAAQAAQEFATIPQFAVIAVYLDSVSRNAAARRVLTLSDAAHQRGLKLLRHAVAAGASLQLPAAPAVRATFGVPADALRVVRDHFQLSTQRLRQAIERASKVGDGESESLLTELLREVDGSLVEAEIMSDCPAVQGDAAGGGTTGGAGAR